MEKAGIGLIRLALLLTVLQQNVVCSQLDKNSYDGHIDGTRIARDASEVDSNVTYALQISRHDQSSLTFSIQLREIAGGTTDASNYSMPIEFHPEDESITVPITITRDGQVETTQKLLIHIMPASSVSDDQVEEERVIQITPASLVSSSIEPSVISEDGERDVAVSVFVYTILIIFVLAPPLIIILIVIIIVVCCKKKKNTNKSVKQEYAAGENPSHSNWTPPTPRSPEHHEMRKVSSEFADAGHSTLGPLGTTKHYHMNMRP